MLKLTIFSMMFLVSVVVQAMPANLAGTWISECQNYPGSTPSSQIWKLVIGVDGRIVSHNSSFAGLGCQGKATFFPTLEMDHTVVKETAGGMHVNVNALPSVANDPSPPRYQGGIFSFEVRETTLVMTGIEIRYLTPDGSPTTDKNPNIVQKYTRQ